ncbi:hypothetical protein Leryth_013194 [Lithospermum erythrorhizon]|nr:hypothetical protein Leryth_013194 [Lithospermum erythrorhizon]
MMKKEVLHLVDKGVYASSSFPFVEFISTCWLYGISDICSFDAVFRPLSVKDRDPDVFFDTVILKFRPQQNSDLINTTVP